MEQTRQVYEDTSNQLGYIFELFSDQLALSPCGKEVGSTNTVRKRAHTMVDEEDNISSIQSRRKSTSCTNTQNRKQNMSYKKTSTSTDFASDTSSMDQGPETKSLPRCRNRRVGRDEKFRYRSRTLDNKHNKHTKHSINQEVGIGYPLEHVTNYIVEDDMENNNLKSGSEVYAVGNDKPEKNKCKKKSSFHHFLVRLKTFLLKENKYELRPYSY